MLKTDSLSHFAFSRPSLLQTRKSVVRPSLFPSLHFGDFQKHKSDRVLCEILLKNSAKSSRCNESKSLRWSLHPPLHSRRFSLLRFLELLILFSGAWRSSFASGRSSEPSAWLFSSHYSCTYSQGHAHQGLSGPLPEVRSSHHSRHLPGTPETLGCTRVGPSFVRLCQHRTCSNAAL